LAGEGERGEVPFTFSIGGRGGNKERVVARKGAESFALGVRDLRTAPWEFIDHE